MNSQGLYLPLWPMVPTRCSRSAKWAASTQWILEVSAIGGTRPRVRPITMSGGRGKEQRASTKLLTIVRVRECSAHAPSPPQRRWWDRVPRTEPACGSHDHFSAGPSTPSSASVKGGAMMIEVAKSSLRCGTSPPRLRLPAPLLPLVSNFEL